MSLSAFYLGAHHPVWLSQTEVPLFVSYRSLARRRGLPRALGPWALDSGAFTELNRGAWTLRTRDPWSVTTAEYADGVERFREQVGLLDWAAPTDLPCEPSVVHKNGLDVREHQRRTLENFLDLRARLGELVVPVVQGWEPRDYRRHVADYAAAGVDLAEERLVGVGSICRRHADDAIALVLHHLEALGVRRAHAFGVRGSALRRCSRLGLVASADSMAWSYAARWDANHGLPTECGRRSCVNCLHYALSWRARLLAGILDTKEAE